MSTDIELVSQDSSLGSLAILREPEQVLADAQKVAAALMRVVSSKKKQIQFNGETYLESGDWQTVGAFHGVTAKVEWTRYVEYGDVRGFEAAAVAIDRNGREVSRGEAMCLNDEENWGMRARYEWQDVLDSNGRKIWEFNKEKGKELPKRQKVQVGETATPLFQLRSMAQTRACAKALSNLFKWVVVLAGYKPTPAEEMTGVIDREPDLPSEQQAPNPTSPASPTNQSTSGTGGTASTGGETTSAISHDDSEPVITPRSRKGAQPSTQAPSTQPAASQGPAIKAGEVFPPEQKQQFEPPISKPQSNRYFAIMKSASVTDEQSAQQLASLGWHGSRDEMPKRIYNAAIDLLDPQFKFHTAK
jgi:hypothetical protein